MKKIWTVVQHNCFLFQELVKRDFKKKYKRSVLGMFWSVLSPLCTLAVMNVIFSNFFEGTVTHYMTFLFAGNILWSYFRDATNEGMYSLVMNGDILKKINIPKYLFLASKNVSALINFMLTFVVFLIFAALDGVTFSWMMLGMLYPVVCMTVFNLGVGMILSALFVFFMDTKYLYDIAMMLAMYASAIFYDITTFPDWIQMVFHCNPVFVYIKYFRIIVLQGTFPDVGLHLLCAFYAVATFVVGMVIYRKNNYRFIYYL